MLEDLKEIWSVDWGVLNRKNWAEKERLNYQKGNKADYEFYRRRLKWLQSKSIRENIQRGDLERIGKNPNGYKINMKVRGNAVRTFGFLENDHSIFHALLLLIKKLTRLRWMI